MAGVDRPRVSWQPEVDELKRRIGLAQSMGGPANVDGSTRAASSRSASGSIAWSDAGTFHETGALTGKAVYEDGKLVSITPSNYVVGHGRDRRAPRRRRRDDFTVRGGAADGSIAYKAGYGELMASELRLPSFASSTAPAAAARVKTLDEISARTSRANPAWDTVIALLGEVPVVGACMGSARGPRRGARRLTSHFSVMVKGSSQLFVAGPPVVERGVGRGP
jgi:acetyl-CoA carboxylase carboxyltransferase component